MRDAASSSSSPEVLREISRSRSESVRTRLAANPATPGDVVMDLLRDEAMWRIKADLGSHPNLPAEGARLLLELPRAHSRMLENPHVPAEVVEAIKGARRSRTSRGAK